MSNYRAGDKIDNRYLIERHIGSGGFADVYKAKDEMTGAIVAIKIYNSMDDHGVEIFRQEYQAVSGLNHQRLLRAEHFNVYEGSPYLIMAYCELGNLTRLLIDAKSILPEKKLAMLLFQIAEGLEYLHRKGVIHQDIKPDNILELEEEEYVLSDFGISQRAKSTLARSVRRTEKIGSNSSGYTPAYAPPARERLSTRAAPSKDIFSLGATLYELSAKQLPYNDMGEAVDRKLEIPSVEHGYSQGWNDLLKSCLCLNPEDRPTAKKLKEAAQYFLANGTWDLVSEKQAAPTLSQKEKPEAATIKNTNPENKKHWLTLLGIPVIALLGWGVFEMMPKKEIIDPVPIVKKMAGDSTDVFTKKPKEEPKIVAAAETKQQESTTPKEDAKQKEYTDLMASAERNFKRGNYKNALAKFQKAKEIISDDKAAQKGIKKSENKIATAQPKRYPKPEKGSFTDSRDGQVYPWVKMRDGRKWMAKNLNYKMENSWCYEDKESNGNKYGRLYNLQSVKKACPSGWHLPSDGEWKKMINYYGAYRKDFDEPKSVSKKTFRAFVIGGASGFDCVFGGIRHGNETAFPGTYGQSPYYAYYWTSTEMSDSAWGFSISKGYEHIGIYALTKSSGRSCRCIQN